MLSGEHARERAMAHDVDGFELKYVGRTWKAERREHGKLLDVVPVTWTKGTRTDGDETLQEVWYQNIGEMEERLADPAPFVVAVAKARDYGVKPHAFKEFKAIYEVVASGVRLTHNSIQTRVLRRLRGGSGDSHA
jgi:hypothetical protein